MAKKLSDMSDEELLKWHKTVKAIVYMMMILVGILFVLTIILSFKRGFSALNVLPVALLPIALSNLVNLNNIKKEITARNIK